MNMWAACMGLCIMQWTSITHRLQLPGKARSYLGHILLVIPPCCQCCKRLVAAAALNCSRQLTCEPSTPSSCSLNSTNGSGRSGCRVLYVSYADQLCR
mgnify:FL=1